MRKSTLARLGYELVARHFPPSGTPIVGGLCRGIRYWLCRKMAVECGKRVNLEHGASVEFGKGIRIGDYSGLGIDSVVEGPIVMGQNVLMGPEVIIYRRKHHEFGRTDISIREQRVKEPPRELHICDDVWIGRRVIILKGCGRIGRGAIIGAGAVVTKDVADYSIVAGNPAREVRKRKLTHDPAGETKLTLPSGGLE